MLRKFKELFWNNCVVQTKDNFKKERENVLHIAVIDCLGQAEEHMDEYNPWWCSHDVWSGMCTQWWAEEWTKKCKINAKNRVVGAAEGEKVKGTYKGGSISQ